MSSPLRDNMHMVLEGHITLLAPLSHIGESISTDSYLNTVSIIGPDSQPEDVFIYSGNAWRGMMRDLGAKYLLEKLSIGTLPLEMFYLLFSGGNIGGEQKIDLEQARRLRKALPFFSLYGGGVGNQILGGKLNVGAMYPICRECERVLPEALKGVSTSWREWITEQSYTRTDDAKDERLTERFMRDLMIAGQKEMDAHLLPETTEQRTLNDEIDARADKAIDAQLYGRKTGGAKQTAQPPKDSKGKRDKQQDKAKDGPAQQMRYTQELMAPGSEFWQRIDLRGVNELEAGALVSCLHEFAKHPYIGGQARIGHGLCRMAYTWRDLREDGGRPRKFLTAGPEGVEMGERAQESMDAYNEFLAEIYSRYLADNRQPLAGLISGKEATAQA